jgi:hypothetical protein
MTKLTDAIILAAQPPETGYKALTDGRRLFLRITPDGGLFWRLKYVIGAGKQAKESQASLGKYPDVSIAQARHLADEIRAQAANGKNPVRDKRDEREAVADAKALTFGVVAREWLEHATTSSGEPWGARTKEKHAGEVDKLKSLHGLPILDIKSDRIMTIVQAIEKTKPETAKRVGQTAANVFSFANARHKTGHNPAADRKYWLRAVKHEHHAALTDPAAVGTLMGLIDGGWGGVGSVTVNNAMRFLARTFPRQGERLILRRLPGWRSRKLSPSSRRRTWYPSRVKHSPFSPRSKLSAGPGGMCGPMPPARAGTCLRPP